MAQLLTALGVLAASGLPGLCFRRDSQLGQWLTTLLAVAGAGWGIACTLGWWRADASVAHGTEYVLRRDWSIPLGQFYVALDGLSAMFLLPILVVSLFGSVYGLAYWRQSEHPDNARKLRLFYGIAAAGMGLLVVSRDAVLFLIAWEFMALSVFMLVATEDDRPDVREASWLYLAATHTATLLLFALFGVWYAVQGSFELAPLRADAVSPAMANTLFLLALVGFGFKAGVMPLHVWLPSAHANSPSHVSALMSGVVIKMGVYGLVRMTGLLPTPPAWWGGLLLGAGVVSAILGIAFAVGQRDIKRLLAYSSIENIGVIVLALGLAMVGRSLDQPAWIALGLGGALLHVWNHALFKSLLFFCAGSIIHATGTREMNLLGGLAKRMPATATCFLIGATGACALPPLNGFVSELLIYLGLFRTLGSGHESVWAGSAFAAPMLALVGALAVAAFAGAMGVMFLGTPRSTEAQHAHESRLAMLAPMALLALGCLGVGLLPRYVVSALDRAVLAWNGPHDGSLADLAPWREIAGMNWALVGVSAALAGGVLILLRRSSVEYAGTWGCGYLAPTPRMQYSTTSVGEMLVALFGWALRPRIHRPRIEGLFPQPVSFSSDVPEVALDEVVMPTATSAARGLIWFRYFQQGNIQAYLLYIFAILIVLLLWK